MLFTVGVLFLTPYPTTVSCESASCSESTSASLHFVSCLLVQCYRAEVSVASATWVGDKTNSNQIQSLYSSIYTVNLCSLEHSQIFFLCAQVCLKREKKKAREREKYWKKRPKQMCVNAYICVRRSGLADYRGETGVAMFSFEKQRSSGGTVQRKGDK